MSTRQELTNAQKEQQKVYIQRAEEYTQEFKGPVLSHQATGNQVIPNVIDNLIKRCLGLHQQIDTLTSQKQKIEGELATLKAVANSDKKKGDSPSQGKEQKVPDNVGSTPKSTEK